MPSSMSFNVTGSYAQTEAFLKKLASGQLFGILGQYGEQGVAALRAATPSESGETANSWTSSYEVSSSKAVIYWRNTHMAGDTSVAILLQFGHGTGTGGYVQGRDYINPVMRPLFDKMANDVWRAVIR